MNNLGDIFDKKLNQMGIKKQVEASLIVEEAQNKINEIFGEKAEENLKVISFNKGTLKIAARTSAWAAECQGHTKKLATGQVSRVVFGVGNLRLDQER